MATCLDEAEEEALLGPQVQSLPTSPLYSRVQEFSFNDKADYCRDKTEPNEKLFDIGEQESNTNDDKMADKRFSI